ncbi:uncharacterized protein MYCFIDRAFT_210444 [Pseudocercospora fijiensis CIRAD86]|uniref:LDB19 N-terminal domain-containing protein n=1 Tax=Pseudocercospora fijiensis (strain CIRAD86) TaxID=383855 RepID=M2Z8X3_PSEFD|nr:uncharacterized protein MYCFIDRAFT_210444 [Pseudocercospora fijiensis CIRAD86]EME86225.1 hypothetical protein MYCFIDRAFT_210444 [Pseudocercospora fijiensis CIRAD86]
MPAKIFAFAAPSFSLETPLASKKSSTVGQSHPLAVRRPSMDHIKRPNLLLSKKHSSEKKSKSKDRASSKDKHAKDASPSPAPKPIQLGMIMESPPVVMIDSPQQSSGALISGRIQITPILEEATLASVTLFLECTTSTKRPVQDKCRDCLSKVRDLYEWNFLSKPKKFRKADGVHEIPFSQLLPGHLPATTHGTIGSIDYQLHMRAKSVDGHEIEFRRELVIQRALRPGNDKNSVRVFPPTNLTLHVTLPNIVHPLGEFPVTCRMEGIVSSKKLDTQTRWKLRKLTWRIEEHEVSVSPACADHASKVGGEGKGVQHESTRDVGMQELKEGWKTDLSNEQIEGEFMASLNAAMKPQCDMTSANGMKISHNLILELVIAEEWAPNKKPHQATPTGAARVLRTQFALNVTERCGMGIAWDDEMPPQYDDVPASPPHYQNERTTVQIIDRDEIHGDVEHLSLDDAAPPYDSGYTSYASSSHTASGRNSMHQE